MQKAHALHIGLNSLDPDQYRGWNGALSYCENDAKAMLKISTSLNYDSTKIILTKKATKANFHAAFDTINQQLKSGDLFLLTFSGHGGQKKDLNGDEPSGYDQTWCFYDGEIIDDSIHDLLKTVAGGVRVLIISDSCFSGSIFKKISEEVKLWGQSKWIELSDVKASIRLIASSQDTQESVEARGNGLFTTALLAAWEDGDFEGNYTKFYDSIVCHIPYGSKQIPNHLMAGPVDVVFDESKPFVLPEENQKS